MAGGERERPAELVGTLAPDGGTLVQHYKKRFMPVATQANSATDYFAVWFTISLHLCAFSWSKAYPVARIVDVDVRSTERYGGVGAVGLAVGRWDKTDPASVILFFHVEERDKCRKGGLTALLTAIPYSYR